MKPKPTRKMPSDDQKPTNEDIATAAYQLYVESGYQDGHDQENWFRAENSLTQKLKSTTRVQAAEPQSNTTNQSSQIRNQEKPKLPVAEDLQWNPERTTKSITAAPRAA